MRTLTQITAAKQRQPWRMAFDVKPGESIFSGIPSLAESLASIGVK
jgi:hypothetical protein